MRTPLIAGNWKMNKTPSEARALLADLVPRVSGAAGVEVAVAPPFPALEAAAASLTGSPVRLAAQNVHWEPAGAFTGEVSAAMLADLGVAYVIVGHSERRQLFGDTDASVARRAAAALSAGITPIVCVGESLSEREDGRALEVVGEQVRNSVGPLGPGDAARVVLAYEPVWAIGTGRTATSAQAQEVHAHIRSVLVDLAGHDRAAEVRILYGGSVKPDNVASLMAEPDVDGALVGGASLDAETFASVVCFRV